MIIANRTGANANRSLRFVFSDSVVIRELSPNATLGDIARILCILQRGRPTSIELTFGGGPSGRIRSVNGGVLIATSNPNALDANLKCNVELGTSAPKPKVPVELPNPKPKMREADRRALERAENEGMVVYSR